MSVVENQCSCYMDGINMLSYLTHFLEEQKFLLIFFAILWQRTGTQLV